MDNAFAYTEENALETLEDYPYTGWAGAFTCLADAAKGLVSATYYCDVAISTQALKDSIAQRVTSVAIQANQAVFQNYTSGVITSGCGEDLDHGVTAVGFGVENGVEYVLVKNSWGTSWGENGYVKIAPNMCGITTSASTATA